MTKQYLCIDLKSFYASVECVERGLNPLTANLVVADVSRTEKTICLAVTPSLKTCGISGRARLFEVVQKMGEINKRRKSSAPGKKFDGESYDATELKANPALKATYIIAPPRMAHYMEYSTRIYNIYLKYIAPEDIHVYSIDEVFIDITGYLNTYKCTAHELAMKIIKDVLNTTGITATAGIGTNMYLAKIAMDIVAKKIQPNEDGVRISELDEISYRKELWNHTPITDFWRVGKGYAKKLTDKGIYTMGDIARLSLTERGEDLLYKTFGINAELLIDHAWGWEPCTIAEIKAYKPENKSIASGQVLHCPYDYEKTKIIVREMAELMCTELVEKRLVTNQLVLTVGYDIENLTNPELQKTYSGDITTDFYGRKVPKHAHGTTNLDSYSSSAVIIVDAVINLYEKITNKNLLIRRLNISANKLRCESEITSKNMHEQLSMFTDYEALQKEKQEREIALKKERSIQETMISLKNKYGKNAILKGTNLQEGSTTVDRNNQIGGHKA